MTEGYDRLDKPQRRCFPPYSEYRDSGIEWLGETPKHWDVKRLTDLANLINGFPFDSKLFDRYNGTPLVRIRDLFTTATEVKWSGDSVPEAEIRDGDILIGMDGDFSVAWWAQGPALLNQRLCCVRAHSIHLSQRYLFHCLSFPLKALNDVTYATTVKHLSSLNVLKFRLPFPPLNEQCAIAAFLDRETARIDALVARKERLIELLQEKRIALITRAVTRGLDTKVPMKDSGVEWLGEIPAHWEVKKVKRLFRRTKRQGFSKLTVLSVYRDYGVIKKSSRDDNFNRTPQDLDNYQLVNPGDLVINKMKAWQGSLGVSSLSGITSPDYVVYAPDHGENARFLHHFLRCKLLARVYLTISNGIRPSQWRIEPERFEDLVVLVPPPKEQDLIAAFLDTQTVMVDTLTAKAREAVDRLMEFRHALISAVVTGKIDVREEAF